MLMGSGRGLDPFPPPALPRVPATVRGKGLKVLRQLEPPHLPCAVSVLPVFAVTFIWGTEGFCGSTQETVGLWLMHFKLLVLSIALSTLFLLSWEKVGKNSMVQWR